MRMRKCANCGHRYPLTDTRCPECEVHAPREQGPEHVDTGCAWNSNGERCKYPGTISSDTLGKGPYYCSLHYGVANPIVGADIVRASQSYQPIDRSLVELQAQAARFCEKRGLTTVEQMREYRLRLTLNRPPSTEWARRILARKAKGMHVDMICERFALEALGPDEPDAEVVREPEPIPA